MTSALTINDEVCQYQDVCNVRKELRQEFVSKVCGTDEHYKCFRFVIIIAQIGIELEKTEKMNRRLMRKQKRC